MHTPTPNSPVSPTHRSHRGWSVQVMDGRFFSGTQVEAYIADGNEKFKKTSAHKAKGLEADGDGDGDGDDDESRRLEQFRSWLEEDVMVSEA